MTALLEQKMTWHEFREIDFPENDPFFYELINGELTRKQAPSPLHQEACAELIFALKSFLKEKPIGRVFPAPVDVFFDDYNCVQPDICFVTNERDFIIDKKEGILGTPDLIVEVISPGSVKRDRSDKKDLYERFAVKEYWLVDPNNCSVEIYVMRENAFRVHQILESEGKAQSSILAGFELEINQIFQQNN